MQQGLLKQNGCRDGLTGFRTFGNYRNTKAGPGF